MVSKSDRIWMPHAGHFICARDCQFILNTFIPCQIPNVVHWQDVDTERLDDYSEAVATFFAVGAIVSTVGEYLPDSLVREIYATSRGIQLEGKGDYREADFLEKHGFVEIGAGRKYETMVFPGKRVETADEQCCPFRMAKPSEADFAGYNEAADAYRGHSAMCEKWAKRMAGGSWNND